MNRLTHPLALGVAALGLFVGAARGQDYQDSFKKPETALEYWSAMKYEISVGNFTLAAADLKGFLEKKPTEKELLDIEGKEGITAFLQLLAIPELRKDAGPLLEQMSQVLQKHLANPERINKFIKNLSATPEERAYALDELKRSRAFAVPYLVEALRNSNDSSLHSSVLSAMLRLKKDVVPALVAALDVDNAGVRSELIDLIRERRDTEAVPFLWFPSASPKQPDYVRRKAKQAITYLLNTDADRLPSAKAALTEEANRFYAHQIKFPEQAIVWQMTPDGKQFVLPPPVYTASQAEEHFGLRFARQALELDPAYEPAQVVFLSLALEKATERAGLDQPLEKGSPHIKDLLHSVNPDLVTAVLERALKERRTAVALGAVRALGNLTEARAAHPKDKQNTPALVRALSYPDRRVQIAAADALLHFPIVPPEAKGRIVEVLRRALVSDATAKALIADANVNRAGEVGQAVKQAGYEPVVVNTGREALRRLSEAADIDVLLVDQGIPDPDLTYFLAQLRADGDSGHLPVLVTVAPERAGTVPPNRAQSLARLAANYRNVWVVPATLKSDTLKQTLAARVADAVGKPLTEEERKNNAAVAMLWLKKMAVGEVPGFDVRPAEAAVLKALHTKELAALAVEAAGAFPDRQAQRELAAVVLDSGERPEVRSAAAVELNRHIQHHGVLLTADQVGGIENLFESGGDPKLRGNVALVIGSMRPNAAKTGARLRGYAPPLPSAAPAPEKEKEEKEKPAEKPEKDKEKEKEKTE